jgi:ornithine cyclodeaminase
MRFVSATEIDATLSFPALINAIANMFRTDIHVPVRHHHAIEHAAGTLLLMPAWTEEAQGNFIGTKIVTVFPDNAKHGIPSVTGTYLLMSGETGEPLAGFDGRMLTLWRTAAASALASVFLSHRDSQRLLLVGAGALSPYLARAHASVRQIQEVSVWNRSGTRAEAVAADLRKEKINAHAVTDLQAAANEADIISCATLSSEPLVQGRWLKPGSHLDLVGGFKPTMREVNDEAIRCSCIYVDTRIGALKEAGDIVDPIRRGILRETDIRGDFFDLCRNKVKGRISTSEITLFKSVGTAVEDLAAAMLVWRKLATT